MIHGFVFLVSSSFWKEAGSAVPSRSLSFFLANDLHFFIASLQLLGRDYYLGETTPRRQKICGNGLSRHRPVGTRKDFIEDKATTLTSSSPPVHRLNFFFPFAAFCRQTILHFAVGLIDSLLSRELFRDRSSEGLCPPTRSSSDSLRRYVPRCTRKPVY